jgi:hypothetical protein
MSDEEYAKRLADAAERLRVDSRRPITTWKQCPQCWRWERHAEGCTEER